MKKHAQPHKPENLLELLHDELTRGLKLYWETAAGILSHSGVRLAEPQASYYSPQANFFSTLFLYSYYRQEIDPSRRVMYAAVNQCLRGMVTGCDNLLDDEYKMTLDTDLPSGGTKFRSILDIMVSDRVLFQILLDFCSANEIGPKTVTRAMTASLQALARSGAQEASEEAGIEHRLTPRLVLSEVHHYKTGLLFLSPWAVPAVIEGDAGGVDNGVAQALYRIGMGCQILDDLVDLAADVHNCRHNYVASLIAHSPDPDILRRLQPSGETAAGLYAEFPGVFETAHQTALDYLESGLSALYLERHRFLLQPALAFISKRIGVDRIKPPASSR